MYIIEGYISGDVGFFFFWLKSLSQCYFPFHLNIYKYLLLIYIKIFIKILILEFELMYFFVFNNGSVLKN